MKANGTQPVARPVLSQCNVHGRLCFAWCCFKCFAQLAVSPGTLIVN